MIYNPPGVGSSGSIAIPGDKNEVVIPLTANESAQLNTWKIVVVGSAGVAGGAVEAATDYAQLTVSDTYFDLVLGKTAAELGQEAVLPVQITKKQNFPGNAKAELVGLPAGTSSEPVEFNQDATRDHLQDQDRSECPPGPLHGRALPGDRDPRRGTRDAHAGTVRAAGRRPVAPQTGSQRTTGPRTAPPPQPPHLRRSRPPANHSAGWNSCDWKRNVRPPPASNSFGTSALPGR